MLWLHCEGNDGKNSRYAYRHIKYGIVCCPTRGGVWTRKEVWGKSSIIYSGGVPTMKLGKLEWGLAFDLAGCGLVRQSNTISISRWTC